jgi:hypothetical protein
MNRRTVAETAERKARKMKRLAEFKYDLGVAKERLLRVLFAIEDERLDARVARRLGTIIGRLEDLQRQIPVVSFEESLGDG